MKAAILFPGFVCLVSKAVAWNHWKMPREGYPERPDYRLIAYVLPMDEGSEALQPEWLTVQKTDMTGEDSIISIDCSADTSRQLCKEESIRSFPTIRLSRRGSSDFERYRGPYKAAAILGFLRRSLNPILSKVDARNITSFMSIDYVVFVGNIAPGDKAVGRFRAAATRYRDRFSFAVAVESNHGTTHPPSSVTCYNNLDDFQHSTTKLESRESLESFIKLCSTPLIPEMTRRNELSFYETRKSIVHYFVRNDKERDDYVKEMRALANKYQEYLHFTTTDVNEYPQAVEMMGLNRGSSRGLSVQNPSNGHVYPYTRSQPLSAGVVEIFLSDIIQGKVRPFARAGGSENEDAGPGRESNRQHEEL